MNKKYLRSVVLIGLIFSSNLDVYCQRAEIAEPKASLTKKLFGGLFSAWVVGSAAWLEFDKLDATYNLKGLYNKCECEGIAVAGVCSAVGAAIGYIATSFFGSRGHEYYKKYKEVFDVVVHVESHEVVAVSIEGLAQFAHEYYKEESSYDAALSDITRLIELLGPVEEKAKGAVEELKNYKGKWYKILSQELHNLLKDIVVLQNDLQEKKEILVMRKECVALEQEYKNVVCKVEKVVGTNQLCLQKMDTLILFIESFYVGKDPYVHALETLQGLRDILKNSLGRLNNIILHVVDETEDWKKALHKQCLDMVEIIKVKMSDLNARIELVVKAQAAAQWEKEYVAARKSFLLAQDATIKLLTSKLLERVRDSYNATISYTLSLISQERAFVAIVRELRGVLSSVRKMIEEYTLLKTIFAEKSPQDSRYNELVEGYTLLIERLKTEFPFALFEERIREVYASDEYEKELTVLEEEKQHENVIQALKNVKEELNGVVFGLKGDVSHLRQDLAGVRKDIDMSQYKITEVNKNVNAVSTDISRVEKEISYLEGNVLNVNNVLSALGREIETVERMSISNTGLITEVGDRVAMVYNSISAHAATDQFNRIESALLSLANVISNLEHDVSELKHQISLMQ